MIARATVERIVLLDPLVKESRSLFTNLKAKSTFNFQLQIDEVTKILLIFVELFVSYYLKARREFIVSHMDELVDEA